MSRPSRALRNTGASAQRVGIGLSFERIIWRPETPITSVATHDSLTPAYSSTGAAGYRAAAFVAASRKRVSGSLT